MLPLHPYRSCCARSSGSHTRRPSDCRVDLIVTELAVIEPTDAGLVLRETAPGVTVEQVLRATAAHLHVPGTVGTMLGG